MKIEIPFITQDGFNFLCAKEGFRSAPYLDSVGVPTIGIGTTCLPNGERVTMNTPCITKLEAIQYANNYLKHLQKWMQNNLKWQPNSNQLIALYSFLYNTGVGSRFDKYVNTKKAIINGDIPNIIIGIKSIRNKGLLDSRRKAECEMFNKVV